MRCSIKQMVIKMKKLIGLLVLILASHQIVQAQSTTSCAEGEVGVVVSLSFTQVFPVGEVTWDIQDADGNIYGTNQNLNPTNKLNPIKKHTLETWLLCLR